MVRSTDNAARFCRSGAAPPNLDLSFSTAVANVSNDWPVSLVALNRMLVALDASPTGSWNACSNPAVVDVASPSWMPLTVARSVVAFMNSRDCWVDNA